MKSDLVTGPARIGVRTEMQVEGISVILGNDLAAGNAVFTCYRKLLIYHFCRCNYEFVVLFFLLLLQRIKIILTVSWGNFIKAKMYNLEQSSSTLLLGTHSPGKFISNRLQHTCLQFSSSLEELDWLLQVCLIRVVAKLFRIVGPQEQG